MKGFAALSSGFKKRSGEQLLMRNLVLVFLILLSPLSYDAQTGDCAVYGRGIRAWNYLDQRRRVPDHVLDRRQGSLLRAGRRLLPNLAQSDDLCFYIARRPVERAPGRSFFGQAQRHRPVHLARRKEAFFLLGPPGRRRSA